MKNVYSQKSNLSVLRSICTVLLICCAGFKGYSTAWTTSTAGAVTTLSNWTNGSGAPTTFTTPGDTWTITMAMSIATTGVWSVGTTAMTPITLTVATGGTLDCSGSGSGIGVVNIYGNVVNSGGTISRGGSGSSGLTLNIYGTLSMSSGDIGVGGSGSGTLIANIHGNTTITGGTISRGGSGTTWTGINVYGNYSMTGGTVNSGGSGFGNVAMNIYGNFSMSGATAMIYTAAGTGNTIHMALNNAAGTMMIDNTSTGTWSGTNLWIDTNCTAQLAGNFSTTTGNATFGLTVDGTLICPSAYTVNGTRKFILNGVATLKVAHATGVNGAIVTTGTRTFSNSANYAFNGASGQVTGTDLPASLVSPDTLTVSNSNMLNLSQTTATTGKLRFTSGILSTGAFTISVPGTATSVTGAGLTSYVNGTLIKSITGLSAVNFEIGDTSYAPMSLALSAAGSAGSIGMKVSAGMHPNVATSGISTSYITAHYWTITNLGAAGPATVTPTGTYNSSTIIGGGNTFFRTQEYAGSAWLGSALGSTNTTAPNTTTPTTGIALATMAGDYIFGRSSNPALNIKTVTTSESLRIFPNPNEGVFSMLLESGNSGEVQIVITNVIGKIVTTYTTVTNKETILTLERIPGVYFVQAKNGTDVSVAKLVIE